VIAALLALGTTLVAGCGDDEKSPAAPAPTVAAATATPEPSSSAEPGQDPGSALASVTDDVVRVAPQLESYYRGKPYPRTVDEVVASLAGADVTLSKGNRVGGYRYDPDAVEFVLCIQNSSGAWATYDTAPMTAGKGGAAGGCPSLV
jgi:hypothetical protein